MKNLKFEPLNVLMIDDDIDEVEQVQEAFTRSPIHVNFNYITDTRQLTPYLEESLEDKPSYDMHDSKIRFPDVILLDIVMPLSTGPEILQEMKMDKRFKNIPVIILTGITDPEIIKLCYEHGAASYIVKPVEYEDLVPLTTHVNGYWVGIVKIKEDQ